MDDERNTLPRRWKVINCAVGQPCIATVFSLNGSTQLQCSTRKVFAGRYASYGHVVQLHKLEKHEEFGWNKKDAKRNVSQAWIFRKNGCERRRKKKTNLSHVHDMWHLRRKKLLPFVLPQVSLQQQLKKFKHTKSRRHNFHFNFSKVFLNINLNSSVDQTSRYFKISSTIDKFVPSRESYFHNYDIHESYLLLRSIACFGSRLSALSSVCEIKKTIWQNLVFATRAMNVNDPRLYNNFNSRVFC